MEGPPRAKLPRVLRGLKGVLDWPKGTHACSTITSSLPTWPLQGVQLFCVSMVQAPTPLLLPVLGKANRTP